jgi:prephenate dehydratase
MRIAIQGEFGSFSHQAALTMEPLATIVPCALSADVFKLVENAEVSAAVIPIENSLAGSVVEHFDLLFQSEVQIERESLLRIRHNLIGTPGSTIDGIRRVLSHPVALAQCRRFFSAHPKMEPTAFYDTAGSVKHITGLRDGEAGAIASEQAALAYGGDVLAAGIEDNPANYTRFFLIRRSADVQPVPDPDKASIAFTVANRPGTLVSALQVFAEHNTNLCKIESRPVHGQPWQYIFYVDFDYQVSGPAATSAALDQLRRQCLQVKELGHYPAAQPLS